MRFQLLALVLWTLLPAHAAAGPLSAVGQVIEVRGAEGAVTIKRGRLISKASRHDYLYPRDEVWIQGPASADVFSVAYPRGRTFSSKDSPVRIDGRPRREQALPARPLQLLRALIDRPYAPPIPVETLAREGERGRPATHDPALPGGLAYVPTGARRVALIWRTAATILVVRGPDGSLVGRFDSADRGAIAIPLPPTPSLLDIASEDGALAWRVERVPRGQAPKPPWMAHSAVERDDGLRTARAVWLVQSGPPEWRVFGLSELEELSDRSLLALRAWQAAEAGTICDPACTAGEP